MTTRNKPKKRKKSHPWRAYNPGWLKPAPTNALPKQEHRMGIYIARSA